MNTEIMKPSLTSKTNLFFEVAFETIKVFSAMAAVFFLLAITGPLAYEIQHLEYLF